MVTQVPLALYLWTRIHQQGTRSIMGVPGDMNLELLDYIKEVGGLSWVGNANELNAAYAADGYARVKDCPGVITTTMGVGELSALNGIGGAYTEKVKVIHIVGTTPTEVQLKRLMIHHNLGPNPDHKVFEKISRHVRCAHTWIDSAETAPFEIDRVIRECSVKSLPVYIYVPMDFVHVPVSATRLERPIDLSPPVNALNESKAVQSMLYAVTTAQNPVVLVDCLASRHIAVEETRQLVDLLEFPVFCTSMGKSIIDETHHRFCGVYNGEVSYPGIKAAVECSDCIINIGPLLADSNTGAHTREIRPTQVIMLEASSCNVFGQTYTDVYLSQLLQKFLVALKGVAIPSVPNPCLPPEPVPLDATSEAIVQSWIWKRLGDFSQQGDTIIVESGTAQFGFPDARFRARVKYITQVYYGSIGYSVGCCLGAAIAQREIQQETGVQAGRTILVVGDGSLQLTVQEIGTMIRLDLNPIIIIINNNGYTIERAIHGADESYNDISTWRHQALLNFFGAQNPDDCSREVRTKVEMETVLGLRQYTNPKNIQLLEVFMGVMDVPWRLRNQINIVKARSREKKAAKDYTLLPEQSSTSGSSMRGINGNALAPELALVGGTGYIGAMIVPQALAALKLGRLSAVRILSSRPSKPPHIPDEFSWWTVDYSDKDSIKEALEGVGILISAAGMQIGESSNKDNIIVAAASVGVRTYMPSDFGTDYTRSKYLDNNMFSKKAAHTAHSRALGLKTVPLFIGLTMERSFLRWVARDANTWRVVGSPDATVSLSSEHDIGKFAIEAVLHAYWHPGLTPDYVRVSSCDFTIRDYAIAYEQVRGTKIIFDIVNPDDARAVWEKRKESIPEGMIGPLIGIMIFDGTFDQSRDSLTDVLSKQAGGMSLTSFEVYLSQSEDCPWEGRVLEL